MRWFWKTQKEKEAPRATPIEDISRETAKILGIDCISRPMTAGEGMLLWARIVHNIARSLKDLEKRT